MEYLQVANNVAISKSAYATIVYYAIREVENTVLNLVKDSELTERKLNQVVSLEVDEYGVVIDLRLELCYGNDLEDVCKKVQENIIDVVEQSVGTAPSRVNIDVVKISVC